MGFQTSRPVKTRTLTVSTPYWTASCRWVFRYGQWEAVIFDKELNFLKGLSPEQARDELEKLGATWQWGRVEDEEVKSVT